LGKKKIGKGIRTLNAPDSIPDVGNIKRGMNTKIGRGTFEGRPLGSVSPIWGVGGEDREGERRPQNPRADVITQRWKSSKKGHPAQPALKRIPEGK